MNLARLQVFRNVARLGSLSAAARLDGVDPSAVSRAIAALEGELGIRLFQRTTRRLTLTEAGEVYLGRIDPLIEELAAAQDAVSGLVERPRGLLRVTASSAYGQTVLTPMLPSFHAAYPEVELELVLSDDLLDLVGERIDLAIRLGARPQGDMVAAQIAPTEKRLVASAAYLRDHPPIRVPQDVAGHACLRFAFGEYRTTWLFRRDGEELSVPVAGPLATTNAMVLRDSAVLGLGLGMISDWMADQDIAEGRLVHVLPDWRAAAGRFENGLWLVYPSRSFLPLKARAFIDHFRARLRGGA